MKLFGLALTLLLALGCGKNKGCMDYRASNYDKDAEVDDNSCEYIGCMDPNASNYDEYAKEDNGLCTYPGSIQFYSKQAVMGNGYYLSVHLDGEYVGQVNFKCEETNLTCESTCDKLIVNDVHPGEHSYTVYYILQTSVKDYDTISTIGPGNLFMNSGACEVVAI